MLLNLLIHYFILKELTCQNKYKKIYLNTNICEICQICQLCVVMEKLEYGSFLQEIDYEVLGELNFLDMCIHETLRMYSPAAS